MKNARCFVVAGSLPKPGWIGRSVRLILGVVLLDGAWSGIRYGYPALVEQVPQAGNWLPIAIALWLLPEVIDLGWGVSWHHRSQLAVLAFAGALSLGGGLLQGLWWPAALGWFVLGLTVYVFLHLGASFVLAALLGTPGCEMRALPYLWTRVTGRATSEHVCPGPIGALDRWELARRSDAPGPS